MNLRDLQYFLAVVDLQHFGKAAVACHVSQPSLSIQIKKLEEYLDVKLFERSSRSVLLTAIGKEIAVQAREVLQRAQAIQEIARQAQDPFAGELNLGMIPSLTPYLLPQVLPELTKTQAFPKLSTYITEQQDTELFAYLEQGKIDAAIVSLPLRKSDFVTHVLFEEELLLTLPIQHPLAKRKTLKARELKNLPLFLLEDGHCLRDQILDFCDKISAKEATNFRAANLEILRAMIATGIGQTLMPRLACKPDQHLAYLSLQNPTPTRKIGIIWRKSTHKKLLLESLLVHLKRVLSKTKAVRVL